MIDNRYAIRYLPILRNRCLSQNFGLLARRCAVWATHTAQLYRVCRGGSLQPFAELTPAAVLSVYLEVDVEKVAHAFLTDAETLAVVDKLQSLGD